MRPRKKPGEHYMVWEATQKHSEKTRDLNEERKIIGHKPRRHNNGNSDR